MSSGILGSEQLYGYVSEFGHRLAHRNYCLVLLQLVLKYLATIAIRGVVNPFGGFFKDMVEDYIPQNHKVMTKYGNLSTGKDCALIDKMRTTFVRLRILACLR